MPIVFAIAVLENGFAILSLIIDNTVAIWEEYLIDGKDSVGR
jgi:hypothetical protein